jgi:hypothetical protein
MKIKLLSVILFLFAFSFSLNAQALFVENFDYPAGDSIGAHGWTSHSGSGTNPITVTSPGLTYSGYIGSGIGNAVTLTTSGQDENKSFTSQNSGSVYCAFMVKVTNTQTTGDYFIHFIQSPTTSNVFVAKVFAKKDTSSISTSFAFGISKRNNSATATYTGFNYSLNTTYLIIFKYTFNTDTTTDDICHLFINPVINGSEPTPDLTSAVETSPDATNIDLIALRQGTASAAPSQVIDGIRVANSWTSILTSVNNITTTVPSKFTLSQNYPNPFNPVTNIRFAVPTNGFVTMKVYNTLGKEVSNPVNQNLNAGSYEVKFDASTLASGMYFYTMNYVNSDGNSFTDTKKLMLVK